MPLSPLICCVQGAHYKMLYDGFWATGAIAPPLNHKTLRHIVGVPNHVRAWRREAYLAIGGHARGLPVADDYDLILRAVFKFPAVYVRHMTYIQVRVQCLLSVSAWHHAFWHIQQSLLLWKLCLHLASCISYLLCSFSLLLWVSC
jgi:hypothetical protein